MRPRGTRRSTRAHARTARASASPSIPATTDAPFARGVTRADPARAWALPLGRPRQEDDDADRSVSILRQLLRATPTRSASSLSTTLGSSSPVRLATQEAVQRAKDAAERASRELEAFSYSVAHDRRRRRLHEAPGRRARARCAAAREARSRRPPPARPRASRRLPTPAPLPRRARRRRARRHARRTDAPRCPDATVEGDTVSASSRRNLFAMPRRSSTSRSTCPSLGNGG